jgi:molybdopterin-containing oxidoreductase family iron-sulfur binding subunit
MSSLTSESATLTRDSRPQYWRSLGELERDPQFEAMLQREFPEAASEFPDGVSRRRWLQLMGASLALGGLSGCWEKEIISPFVSRPANRIPGVPQKYATTWELGGVARPVVVTCYDGRPLKAEGNVEHAASKGATDAYSQALVLHLYDPDRAVGVRKRSSTAAEDTTWDAAVAELRPALNAQREKKGAGLRVLSAGSSSLTLADLKARFEKVFPEAKWVEYDSVSRDEELAGAKAAFGKVVRPQYDLAKAKVIVSLDADLFAAHPSALSLIRGYAAGRSPESGEMNRLYAVESRFTSVGAAADHRLGSFLSQLETSVKGKLAKEPVHGDADYASKVVDAIAGDLVAHQGAGVLIAGSHLPAAVQARVHRLNGLLKNHGGPVTFTEEPGGEKVAGAAALKTLVDEMLAGQVECLVILGGNPAYDAPHDVDFAGGLKKVALSARLGDYEDETSLLCGWHLPKAHPYEAWGDALSYDGTISLAQPLIEPLHSGKSAAEVAAILLEDEVRDGQGLVRRALDRFLDKGSNADAAWLKVVHDGFLSGSGLAAVTPELVAAGEEPAAAQPDDALELLFVPGPSTWDGRFANNGWLQETAEFITKLTWDNVAIVSPATAKKLGVEIGDVVNLKRAGQSVAAPVFITPGLANGTVAVWLGYGRTAGGHVAGYVTSQAKSIQSVGFRAEALRTSDSLWIAKGVEVEKTTKKVKLATTQDHHAIDRIGLEGLGKRLGQLIRETDLEEFKKHPDFAKHVVHHPPLGSLWEERSYEEGHKWGMSIDLSKCVGCNACVVACQSENNVPVVGKEQVLRGREMHWMRLDRYFSGDTETPKVVSQPVMCHHCENAPCEEVCPVAATVHSHEGLNDMVYNRCIGTRYCANNCPYKVRRFNFFNNNKKYEQANMELATLVLNPEVTVRARGVMEKCTYCTQRISAVKIAAKNAKRPINDGEIQTACQQVCPAGAIEFGDLNLKSSKVATAHASDRSYMMLAELNNKPRTAYLARITNPHPSLATKQSQEPHEHHA